MRPHRRQPTRLPCPWDSPGKNTGVGCHFLLQCMKVKSESEVAQSCPTLATPWTAPPGSSVHGIFPGKSTGVGCHCLLRRYLLAFEVAQSCLTLWDPMDWSLPGSTVHGIFQARILEWVAISFSKLWKAELFFSNSEKPLDQIFYHQRICKIKTSEIKHYRIQGIIKLLKVVHSV